MAIQEILLRILLGMFIGGIIGWERETSNRPAGLRTHMLVATGACIVMMMGELAVDRYAGIANMDPTRLGAQVISGIGFIGAGTIMREGLTVRGLTTAASLWAVACLGLAAGGGFYEVAAAGALAILITLTIFEYLENKFRKEKGLLIEMVCHDIPITLLHIKKMISKFNGVLGEIDVSEETERNGKLYYNLICKVRIEKTRKKIDFTDFTAELAGLPEVNTVKVQEY